MQGFKLFFPYFSSALICLFPWSSIVFFFCNPEKFNLDNCSADGSIRCFLQVDLEYSDGLHNLDNDYPFSS